MKNSGCHGNQLEKLKKSHTTSTSGQISILFFRNSCLVTLLQNRHFVFFIRKLGYYNTVFAANMLFKPVE